MKKLICAIALLLAACSEPNYKPADFPVRPPELADCKIFRVENKGGVILYITRCPNSTTSTTTQGKTPVNVIVVDGVEYAPVK